MYIPEHYRVRHDADAVSFMRANPFAILISCTGDGPLATHLPLFVREEEGKIHLRGHVAKANDHWRYLEEQAHCLTIFHGPHSYISPTNYTARESVPTWNYAVVHVYGNARLMTSREELHEVLDELIETFEPAYGGKWEAMSPTFRENMLRQIVGFEIIATRIEGKLKLSQNRTRQDQANVIASLEKANDTAVSGVARMMKEQHLGQVVPGKEDK